MARPTDCPRQRSDGKQPFCPALVDVGYGGLRPSSYDESSTAPTVLELCEYPPQGPVWILVCPADMRICRERLAVGYTKQFVDIPQASSLDG
jgi:hypothetical protein